MWGPTMHIEAVPCIQELISDRERDQIQENTDEYIHTSSGIGYLEAEMLKKDWTSLLASSSDRSSFVRASSIGSEGNVTSHMLVSDFISATENPCLYLIFSFTPLNSG